MNAYQQGCWNVLVKLGWQLPPELTPVQQRFHEALPNISLTPSPEQNAYRESLMRKPTGLPQVPEFLKTKMTGDLPFFSPEAKQLHQRLDPLPYGIHRTDEDAFKRLSDAEQQTIRARNQIVSAQTRPHIFESSPQLLASSAAAPGGTRTVPDTPKMLRSIAFDATQAAPRTVSSRALGALTKTLRYIHP